MCLRRRALFVTAAGLAPSLGGTRFSGLRRKRSSFFMPSWTYIPAKSSDAAVVCELYRWPLKSKDYL